MQSQRKGKNTNLIIIVISGYTICEPVQSLREAISGECRAGEDGPLPVFERSELEFSGYLSRGGCLFLRGRSLAVYAPQVRY